MGDQVVEEVGAADGVDVVLGKIGAKVIAHGRYTVFQMAEVALPRDMFHRVLDMIGELRKPGADAMLSEVNTPTTEPADGRDVPGALKTGSGGGGLQHEQPRPRTRSCRNRRRSIALKLHWRAECTKVLLIDSREAAPLRMSAYSSTSGPRYGPREGHRTRACRHRVRALRR
jgi:hypothetical protein